MSTSNKDDEQEKKSLSTGAIVGIVGLVGILVVAVVVYFSFFHKKRDPYVDQLLRESADLQSRIVPRTPVKVNPYNLPNVSPVQSNK